MQHGEKSFIYCEDINMDIDQVLQLLLQLKLFIPLF